MMMLLERLWMINKLQTLMIFILGNQFLERIILKIIQKILIIKYLLLSNKIKHVDPDNKLPDHIISYVQETNKLVQEVKILLTKKLTNDFINRSFFFFLRSLLAMMARKIIEQSNQFTDTLLLFVLQFSLENLIVGQMNLVNILLYQTIVSLQV